MHRTQKYPLFIIIAILVLFFSPLALYKATYKTLTTSNIVTNNNNNFQNSEKKFTHNGTYYNTSLKIGPSKLAKFDSSIVIKKYKNLNFGLYSKIKIEAGYEVISEGKSITLTNNADFNIYGLGSNSNKKAFAESIVMKEIEKARQ